MILATQQEPQFDKQKTMPLFEYQSIPDTSFSTDKSGKEWTQ
ncbi:MAG: hypothetical protein BWX48_02419 [Verrucomicrobia bacterium ADurb.Bin006]|nr:MAG: hypothetical protein BWX48_02419 [Verrucomicrobia bacterium ADurb.Bin006]